MVPDDRISVVIPVYDGERYLGAAIESVLSQPVEVAEILVVDDGSSDGSVEVARRYPNVRVLPGAHAGISAALNRGISAAIGGTLAFLDADDLWSPHKLEKQIAMLRRASGPLLVFGLMLNFLSPDVDEETRRRIECPRDPLPGLVSGTLVARRSVVRRIGALRTDVVCGGFIDWCARAEDMGIARVIVPEVVLHRRLHGGNTSVRVPEARADFVRVVKTALDRRRAR